MDVPERFDWQQVSGDKNQVFGAVEGSTVFGDVGGNVTIQAAKRVILPFQLPRNVADFTGRVDELAQIEAALTATDGMGAVAISAVAGMAGVGKSALAICAAHRLVGQFPDTQLYVNLQGADAQPRDPSDVLGEWLRALGMDGADIPVALHERQKCYRSLLANQRALVVLDNAYDEAQVRPLLPGGAGCGVIVTSRQVLAALAGTKNLMLKTLPPPDALALLGKIAGDARIVAEQAAAEEIVRLCGYLPLAVEIAGGLLKGRADWSLTADYLPKLRGERGRLNALRQEQGNDVRASFNVSYGQLGEAEQRLFALLGALPGEFGVMVAVAVSELSAEAMLAGLDRLIGAQLVEALGGRRYRYHDLMRLYAREWLGPDDGFAAMERAFKWYWNVAEDCANAFDPERRRRVAAELNSEAREEEREMAFSQVALTWFEEERIQLLTAFDWGCEQKKYERVVSFASNLVGFFNARSYWQDWESTHLKALAATRATENKAHEGITLMNLGSVYKLQGRWDEAITQYQQSLEIFRALGDRHGEGQTLTNLGAVYDSQGRWEEAITQYEQSLEIKRRLGDDHHGEGQTLTNLGNVYQLQGRWEKAITQYEQSLEIFRRLGDLYGAGSTLGNLGNVYQLQGRWEKAIAQYEQGLKICCSLGNRHGEGQILMNLGSVYKLQGRWDDAITQYGQSLEIFRALGDRHGEGKTLTSLGLVYQSRGRWDNAIAQYEQSLEICRTLGDHHGEGQTLGNLGYLYSARAQYDKAIEYWQAAQTKLHPDSPEAKQIAQQLKNPYPTRQKLTGWQIIVIAIVLIFIGFNLLRGHWLIAALTLLAFASFITYRLWKLRRGNR